MTRKVVGVNAIFRVLLFSSPSPPTSAARSHSKSSLSSTQHLNTTTQHNTNSNTCPLSVIQPSKYCNTTKLTTPDKHSTATMSSPSKRSTRSSQQRSSPAPGPSNAAARTPRQTRASQLASSPLFYQSSSPTPAANRGSSPLRQQTETQSAGDRTPRASGALMGGEPCPGARRHDLQAHAD